MHHPFCRQLQVPRHFTSLALFLVTEVGEFCRGVTCHNLLHDLGRESTFTRLHPNLEQPLPPKACPPPYLKVSLQPATLAPRPPSPAVHERSESIASLRVLLVSVRHACSGNRECGQRAMSNTEALNSSLLRARSSERFLSALFYHYYNTIAIIPLL